MSRIYLEIDYNCQDTIIEFLDTHKFKFGFRFVDLNNITTVIHEQQNTINRLEDKILELEKDVSSKEKMVSCVESKIKELTLPSSRKPPPHFKLPDERVSLTHENIY